MSRLQKAAATVAVLVSVHLAFAQQPATNPSDPSIASTAQYYVQRTYGWHRLTTLAFETAFDHVTDQSTRWDRGPSGYALRYGNAVSQRLVANSIELGLSAALREDARYRRSGLPHFPARLRYAVIHSFTATRQGGGTRFAYSRLGALAGGLAITANWHPDGLSGEGLAEGIASGVLDRIGNSLLEEFSGDLKRFGRRMEFKVLRRRR